MLEKCVLTVVQLNWNQHLGHKRTKLNSCYHMLTSSTQLQNRSFHVVERTRTSSKCQKMKNARAKRAKILFFIVKYANLLGFCCRSRRGKLPVSRSLPWPFSVVFSRKLFRVTTAVMRHWMAHFTKKRRKKKHKTEFPACVTAPRTTTNVHFE